MNNQTKKEVELTSGSIHPYSNESIHRTGTEIESLQKLAAIVTEFERRIELSYPGSETHPYHNVTQHLRPMCSAAVKIAQGCWEYGLQPNLIRVRAAARGHDALKGMDPLAMGVATEEEAAAQYSFLLLRSLGAPLEFCHGVKEDIEDTHAKAKPRSLEAQIVRAADLSNLAGLYETVLDNTKKLHREFEIISDTKIEYRRFVAKSIGFLDNYFSELIALTPAAFDDCGRSTWHIKSISNLIQMYREEFEKNEVILNLGVSVVPPQFVEVVSKDTLLISTSDCNPITCDPLRLTLPDTGEVLSIPDKSIDMILCKVGTPISQEEITRVLKTNGRVVRIESYPHLEGTLASSHGL